MPEKYLVTLTAAERQQLEKIITGKAAARTRTHARILLKADSGEGGPGWSDEAIAGVAEVSVATIHRVRQQFVEDGLEAALKPRPPQRTYARKVDGAVEAHLVALACSEPPAGRANWTLQLLADRLVELQLVESLSAERVRQVLKKTNSSPG